MTNSNENENEEKVTMGDHVAETHRSKPVIGQVVTGDVVGGEVRKDDKTGDDSEV
jgi:hypothetical protein